MKTKRETIKKQLMEQYEKQVDKLLEQLNPEDELQLKEIEAAALGIRQQVGADVSQALVNSQGQMNPVDAMCPTCGGRMRYKGRKTRYIRSRSGELEVERSYYYCGSCKAGHFPPG